jgi:hypothetical protein
MHQSAKQWALSQVNRVCYSRIFSCIHLTIVGKDILFQAGVPFSFTVIARDSHSNRTRKGADKMLVTMQGGNTPPAALSLIDNNDGTYHVTNCVEQSSKYYVSVVVDQVPIQGCPFSLFVNGGKSNHF